MRIGFGLVSCQLHPHDPEGRSPAAVYQQAVELARLADSAGLDSIWVTEHHFFDDGYLPAPTALLAAMAAVTSRIRLGAGVMLSPMWNPLRLAEDAAVIDLISAGRLIVGLGLGWRKEEYEAFTVDRKHRGRDLEATIAFLRDAWAADRLAGPAAVPVHPKPHREGGPPIWLGAMSRAGTLRAARLADGFLGGGRSFDSFVRRIQPVLDAERRIEVGGHNPTFIWDGAGDPWKIVRDCIWYTEWKYEDEGSARSRLQPPPVPPIPEDWESDRRETAVIGTPDQVIARLKRYQEVLPPDGTYVARAYHPGLPWDMQRRQIELLAEIAPVFAA